MANLFQKGGIFVARFSYRGREYKKSLKTRDRVTAETARKLIELALAWLHTGQLEMPVTADIAEFIVSGGKRSSRPSPSNAPATLAFSKVVEDYLSSMKVRISPNYRKSQATHLNHLKRYLGRRSEQSISGITTADLNRFIEERLAIRDANTVSKERITLIRVFKWCAEQGYLPQSPAEQLPPIKAGRELPSFRTKCEIERDIARQGLSNADADNEWNRLYLATSEITDLLALIELKSKSRQSYLLHAIPAFTGMRRGEVLRLCWSDIHWDQTVLVARSRKQSRSLQEVSRKIEIHDKLLPILIDWQERGPQGRYVVCNEKSLEPLDPDVANRLFWQPMRGTEWCLDSERNWFSDRPIGQY